MRKQGFSKLLLITLCVLLLGLVRPALADPVTPPLPSGDPTPWPYPFAPPLAPPSPRRGLMQVDPVPIITDPLLDMRVLVVHRLEDAGIRAMVVGYLEALGIPYAEVSLGGASPAGTLGAAQLWDGERHGYYYAIFFTSSATWANLHPDDQLAVETYEAAFGVRHVTLYAYPNPDSHGLDLVEIVAGYGDPACPGDPQGIPFDTGLTEAGRAVFPYLRSDITLTIGGPCIYGYLAQPAAGADVTPLLEDSSGNTILSVFNTADGREHLVLTVSSYYPAIPPAYLHARTLPYGIINWATRGLFLGERRLYFAPQPDDVLAWGDRWDVEAHWYDYDDGYRLEPEDIESLLAWMADFRAEPNAGAFGMELPFNGVGSEEDLDGAGEPISGTLTAKLVEHEVEFIWLNHTYSHPDLDGVSYAAAYSEIDQNNNLAEALGFTDYTTRTLLTGAYSGLNNPNVIQAAYDLGVRYMLADASRPGYNNPTPNTGIPHPDQPELLQVPRNATNIFYAVTTPEEEADLYNYIYCPGYSDDPDNTPPCYTYEEVLELVVNQALGFLLDFNINATMFHMNNLNDYGEGRSLVADYVELLYGKYNALYADDIPVLTLRTQEIGEAMRARMAYNDAEVTGLLACGEAMTLTATSGAVTLPLTGLNYGSQVETYAGQPISYFTLGAGESEVISGETPRVAAPVDGFYLIPSGLDVVLHWDAVTQDTLGDPLEPRAYRLYARANDHEFTPTGADLLAELSGTALTYTHVGGAGDPETVYTYVIRAIGDNCWKRESDLSLRVSVANPNAVGLRMLEARSSGAPIAWFLVGMTSIGALLVLRRRRIG